MDQKKNENNSKGRQMDHDGNMDAIGKELKVNRVIQDAVIQDQEQWAQNVEGYMRGLPKQGSGCSNPYSAQAVV